MTILPSIVIQGGGLAQSTGGGDIIINTLPAGQYAIVTITASAAVTAGITVNSLTTNIYLPMGMSTWYLFPGGNISFNPAAGAGVATATYVTFKNSA